MEMKIGIRPKKKKVIFSPIVDIINVQTIPGINKDDPALKWCKVDEIQSCRKDANMISRAFLTQRIGRKRKKVSSTLFRSKTVCIVGLENRINYKRRLQKASVVQLVLNAQKRFKKAYDFPKLELYLAKASSAATLNARCLALEDAKNVSEEVFTETFTLTKNPNVSGQIFVLPCLNTYNGGKISLENKKLCIIECS